MTTDPSPVPNDASPHDATPAVDVTRLRRRLRSRLERHIRVSGFHPALTVVGLDATRSDVLRHGVDRPEDAVLEFVLPPSYSALAVFASSVVATPPKRTHQDAALAIAVTRQGQVVSMLATNNQVIDTDRPQGWLIDACRRAVDLPTQACTIAALEFPIVLWLDRLMVAILNTRSTGPVGWRDAVELCPIPQRWRSEDAIDLGTTLGSTTRSWRSLRATTIDGIISPCGITPSRAAWMDDAMFARWCMGSFPDLHSLRSDVEFLASDEVAERVATAVRAAWSAFVG